MTGSPRPGYVHPLAWRAILDGRPWVCTEAEAARLDSTVNLLAVFSPRPR